MRLTAALGWIVLLSLLSGCMSSGQPPSQSYGSPRALPISVAAAAQADGAALASPAAQDYRLGPLDVIEISVFGVPELTSTVQVSSGGVISLPLVGELSVADRTLGELEREIERMLGEKYLRSPQVSIFVKDYTSHIVFRTSGEARTAAVFDLKPIRTGQALDPLLVAGDIVVVDQSAARTAWRDLRESIGVLGFFRPAIF